MADQKEILYLRIISDFSGIMKARRKWREILQKLRELVRSTPALQEVLKKKIFREKENDIGQNLDLHKESEHWRMN